MSSYVCSNTFATHRVPATVVIVSAVRYMVVRYEEEDTCVSYEEEDTCVSYEEEDTCVS
jgi:hypothetical protein